MSSNITIARLNTLVTANAVQFTKELDRASAVAKTRGASINSALSAIGVGLSVGAVVAYGKSIVDLGGQVTISAMEQGSGPAAKLAIVHPFQVTDATAAGAAKVKVRSGSVNDVVATGIAPADQTLTGVGTWRVYLDCTLNTDASGAVTAVAVAVTSGAQPANTRTHAYITLATVPVTAVDGGFKVGEISQLATHSLRFYACGRTESEDGSYNFWGF